MMNPGNNIMIVTVPYIRNPIIPIDSRRQKTGWMEDVPVSLSTLTADVSNSYSTQENKQSAFVSPPTQCKNSRDQVVREHQG